MDSDVLKSVEEISGYTPKEMIAMYDDYERMAKECEAYAALGTVEELAALKERTADAWLQLRTATFSTDKGTADLAKFILSILPEAPKEAECGIAEYAENCDDCGFCDAEKGEKHE